MRRAWKMSFFGNLNPPAVSSSVIPDQLLSTCSGTKENSFNKCLIHGQPSTMDHRSFDLPRINPDHQLSNPTAIAWSIIIIYLVYLVLVCLNSKFSSPLQGFWDTLVYLVPARLVLDKQKRQELTGSDMLAQTHAAKSEALKKLFGDANRVALFRILPGESNGPSEESTRSAVPAGLGNWDNSCYQNSVLQGFAALEGLRPFLESNTGTEGSVANSTGACLLHTVNMLNSSKNNGKRLWTPKKLKSMSSWQQQDAQEYFSKIMDELDKESAENFTNAKSKHGLEWVVERANSSNAKNDGEPQELRNPMEGYLAQRVACTKCGYTEGLSMIPFNCVTVPIGTALSYDLEDCFDEYTKLEEIPEVECSKCTLLKWDRQLESMLSPSRESQDVIGSQQERAKLLSLPPELRDQTLARLKAIRGALAEDDFSDKVLNVDCQIPKKGRISSTKSRQAVFMRTPQCLVVHVNRSVFDEFSGLQRKNHASVHYPQTLDLRSWLLDQAATEASNTGQGSAAINASNSMLPHTTALGPNCLYRLKAVITHYGRHENGHYICYRQHDSQMLQTKQDSDLSEAEGGEWQYSSKPSWWRLSDDDVSAVSEGEALAQDGVFMLFYERDIDPMDMGLGNHSTDVNIADDNEIEVAAPNEQDTTAASSHPPSGDSASGLPGSDPTYEEAGISDKDPDFVVQSDDSRARTNTLRRGPQSEVACDFNEKPRSRSPPAAASTPIMRTSHARRSPRRSFNDAAQRFGNVAFRPVAAT